MMPQVLLSVGVHLVWGTRRRQPWLTSEIRRDLFTYIAATVKNKQCRLLAIGGWVDHVHVYVALGSAVPLRTLVSAVKVNSSRWLKQRDPGLGKFRWQRGFAAFGIDPRDDSRLRRYIDSQEQIHLRRDHEEEMQRLAVAYAIDPSQFTWE
jgi:REP element-mobilizing transposase RayT